MVAITPSIGTRCDYNLGSGIERLTCLQQITTVGKVGKYRLELWVLEFWPLDTAGVKTRKQPLPDSQPPALIDSLVGEHPDTQWLVLAVSYYPYISLYIYIYILSLLFTNPIALNWASSSEKRAKSISKVVDKAESLFKESLLKQLEQAPVGTSAVEWRLCLAIFHQCQGLYNPQLSKGVACMNIRWSLRMGQEQPADDNAVIMIPWWSHDYPIVVPWLSHDYPMIMSWLCHCLKPVLSTHGRHRHHNPSRTSQAQSHWSDVTAGWGAWRPSKTRDLGGWRMRWRMAVDGPGLGVSTPRGPLSP